MDSKKSYLLRFRLVITSLLISLSPMIVFADSKASSEITTTPIPYEKGIKYLDRFTSKVWFDKGFWGFGDKTAYLINSFVQGLFWFSKTIFFVCAKIYEKLTDTSQFDDYITSALDSGASVFRGLTSADNGLLYFIGSLMFFYVAYVYFVQNGNFVRTLLKVVLIYACSSMLFYQHDGKYVLQHVYNAMNTVTSEVAEKSVTGLTFTNSDKEKATQGFSTTKEANAVLDKYFDIAVWQPYQYMNAKVTETTNNAVKFDLTEEQLLILLDYDSGNDKFKVADEYIDKFVGKGDDIHHTMLSAAWGEKFTHVLASLVDSLVLGVILDVFAVMSFAMKIILILLMLLSGFVALISMIPTFENVLFNFFKRLGGTVAVSGLLSLCSLILLWIYDILSLLLTGLFIGNPLLIAFSKILVMWYLWKKRDFIVSILTANRVSNLSNDFTRRLSHKGNYWRRRASRNALSRLKMASRTGKQYSSGLVKLGTRKVKSGVRQSLNRFSPAETSKSRLYLDSMKDTGRAVSSKKDYLSGSLKKIRSEGVKDKKSFEYRSLKQDAEKDLLNSRKKKHASIGYRKRKHFYDKGLVEMKQREELKPRVFYKPSSKKRLKKSTNAILQKQTSKKPMIKPKLSSTKTKPETRKMTFKKVAPSNRKGISSSISS